MSDLIDLASPENKKVKNTKLSSPLIPLPIDDYNETCEINPIINLECQQKNTNNNPFDIALQKTNEYISKSEDPFEIVWEKAVNPDNSELHSVNYNEISIASTHNGTIHKGKKNSDVLKMNKILGDTLINNCMDTIVEYNKNNSNDVIISGNSQCQFNEILDNEKYGTLKTDDNLPSFTLNPPSPDYKNLSILNQSVMNDSFSLYNSSDRPSIGKLFNVKDTSIQHNSSILNQSAMDDSLSGSNNSDNGLIKSIVAQRIATCIQKGINEAETDVNSANEKFHKLRRSFSQGDQISVKNIKQISSQSTIIKGKPHTFDDYSMPSILFEDPFNKAFLTGSSSNNATISDISTISSATRLNSVASSAFSTGSNGVNNCAFIEDSSSSIPAIFNGKPLTKSSRRATTSSLAEISDLIAKFDRLKARTSSVRYSTTDLEERVPVDHNTSQQHDITSNSVFHDIDPLKQPILSNTGSKSHYGSNSSSSENDSLPKRPPSAMELLSDIETPSLDNSKGIVDNLIELQTSNSMNEQTESEKKSKSTAEEINKNDDQPNEGIKNTLKTTDAIKELEKELVEPDKKITAATLLMELEKLVNNEKNPKAVELLENLERVLGVKCENNVELLEMYIQNTDAMKNSKTTEDYTDKLLPCDKLGIKNINTSEEDNTNINSNDLDKTKCENFGINNNINIKKVINKYDKCSKVSNNVESFDEIAKEDLKGKVDESQNSFSTQKLVVDIQYALQKLVTSNNSDPIAFLKNLNKLLNPTANESEEKLEKTPHTQAPPITCISTSTLEKSQISRSSAKSSIVRRSVESSNTLKKPTVLQRRSSVSRINNMSLENNIKTKTRIDSPKKVMVRRSSSDPDFVNNIKLTKNIPLNSLKLKPSVPIANKNILRKNCDTAELTKKKGPLKALIPLGNMQRRESAKKLAPLIIPPTTPPSHKSNVSSKFIRSTSTPLPDFQINVKSLKSSPKRKPVASSTPQINSKSHQDKFLVPQTPKHNMSWNISPVTPTASENSTQNNNILSRNNSMRNSRRIIKNQVSPKSKSHTSIRSERTPENPKKISFLPRGQLLTQSDGKTKYGRRSEPIKTALSAKTDLLQKMGKQRISSPLKESNTPGKKLKTMNLLSKFQRRSGSVHVVEKENKWK